MTSSMLRRQLKNLVQNYSEAEVKVREATSNDPWGPSSSQMADISDLTYNVVACNEIMTMLWKRLKDDKNWRHIHKSLTLLEYLLKTGDDRVMLKMKDNVYIVKALTEFRCVDKDGKDQGVNVREKAKVVLVLMEDDEKLKQERDFAVKTREKTSKNAAASSSDTPKDPNYKPVYTPGATGLPSLDNIPSVADLAASFAARKEERLKQEAEKREAERRAKMTEEELKWEDAGKGDKDKPEAWGGASSEDKEEVKPDLWGEPEEPKEASDPWGAPTKPTTTTTSASNDLWGAAAADEDPFAAPAADDPFAAESNGECRGDPFAAPKDKPDPFTAPIGAEDPFAQNKDADPFNTPKDDPFSTPKDGSDPFSATKLRDPFAAPKDKPDPFSCPEDDPFNAPNDDPFNALKDDSFTTPKNGSDLFSAPATTPPKGDPFASPVPPKGDPFSLPTTPPREDPFASPAPSREDPFAVPTTPPREDPFASPAPSREDPFAVPAPSREDPFAVPTTPPREDPFASPAPSKGDPFTVPTTPPREDPFHASAPPKNVPLAAPAQPPKEDPFSDPSDPFSAPAVGVTKSDADAWGPPAASPPATSSDPWGAPSTPLEETAGGDAWGSGNMAAPFGDSSKPEDDPWGAPAAAPASADDAWGSPAPPSDAAPSDDPFGGGASQTSAASADPWGAPSDATSSGTGKRTLVEETSRKTAAFLGSAGALLVDLDCLLSPDPKPKQRPLLDTLAPHVQTTGVLKGTAMTCGPVGRPLPSAAFGSIPVLSSCGGARPSLGAPSFTGGTWHFQQSPRSAGTPHSGSSTPVLEARVSAPLSGPQIVPPASVGGISPMGLYVNPPCAGAGMVQSGSVGVNSQIPPQEALTGFGTGMVQSTSNGWNPVMGLPPLGGTILQVGGGVPSQSQLILGSVLEPQTNNPFLF